MQFLLIGSFVATVYALAPRYDAEAPRAPTEEIVITEGQIDQVRQLFERTWRRPPTEGEEAGLIDSFVREEVLYRAGRGLGLDEDDAIVRRRVAQKMEFLMEPGPNEIAPTDAELAAHLAAHVERFRQPAEIGFRQVFVDPARHRGGLDRLVAALRERLAAGEEPSELGDQSLLPDAVGVGSIRNTERVFGQVFAAKLLTLPVGEWVGPVESPYGLHLVRVEERVPARDADLDDIRPDVRADFIEQRRRKISEERFRELEARYRIVVEGPVASTSPRPAALAPTVPAR